MSVIMSRGGTVPAKDISAVESFNQICTVRIELRDTDPLIWREVEVPTSITLKVLHDIIQITMGWLDYHLWEFTIGGRIYGLPMDEDWGMAPRIEAIKTRLRDVLKPRETTISYRNLSTALQSMLRHGVSRAIIGHCKLPNSPEGIGR
jgi:hypothetical protein